jgi:hypothetical protein
MRNVWLVLASVVIGAASFWLPNMVLVGRILESSSAFTTVTLACPLALLAVYGIAIWWRKGTVAGPSSALFALAGVWVAGPWMMVLSTGLSEGAVAHKFGITGYGVLFLMTICPPLTLYFSAMQGNVFALILATVLMPVCHRLFEKGRWVIPPAWKQRIHFRGSRSIG